MFEHKVKIGSTLQPNFSHDITLFKSNCLYIVLILRLEVD